MTWVKIKNVKSDSHEELSHAIGRSLICIACGGLNDSLSSIGKCFDICFAENKYQSLIICDAYSDGLMGQLKHVFDIKRETYRDSRLAIKRIAKIRTRIPCEQVHVDNIFEIKEKIDSSRDCALDRTDFPCTPDMQSLSDWVGENSIQVGSPTKLNKKCDLFIGFGGGPPSRTFLRALSLKKNYRLLARQIMEKLPEKYDSIHIRNTDMRTDYMTYFHSIRKKIKHQNKLVVCSDDPEIETKASDFFGENKVYKKNELINEFLPFLTTPQPSPNMRSHDPSLFTNNSDKKTFVVRAVADLLCLASADNLFFGKTIQSYVAGEKTNTTSGYSLLAEIIKKDPTLLSRNEYNK